VAAAFVIVSDGVIVVAMTVLWRCVNPVVIDLIVPCDVVLLAPVAQHVV